MPDLRLSVHGGMESPSLSVCRSLARRRCYAFPEARFQSCCLVLVDDSLFRSLVYPLGGYGEQPVSLLDFSFC